MPADLNLSRERIVALVVEMRGYFDGTLIRDTGSITATTAEIHDVLMRALSEPTRLAAARAEGYREGVEAAIADAVAVSIRDEVDSYEMRDDGGGGYSPTDDERIMLEDFGAGLVAVFEQRLRALSPPPAEPAQPNDGPGVWGRTAARQSQRITALEAENAALKAKMAEADRALAPFAGIGAWLFARDLPDAMPLVDILGINGASGVLTRGDFKAAHTARALLQGQGGGDA